MHKKHVTHLHISVQPNLLSTVGYSRLDPNAATGSPQYANCQPKSNKLMSKWPSNRPSWPEPP